MDITVLVPAVQNRSSVFIVYWMQDPKATEELITMDVQIGSIASGLISTSLIADCSVPIKEPRSLCHWHQGQPRDHVVMFVSCVPIAISHYWLPACEEILC